MGRPGQQCIQRNYSLFIDNLGVYQPSQQKLEVANQIIVKTSMDTSACYEVKKSAEAVYNAENMINREGLIDEKMKALDLEQNKA